MEMAADKALPWAGWNNFSSENGSLQCSRGSVILASWRLTCRGERVGFTGYRASPTGLDSDFGCFGLYEAGNEQVTIGMTETYHRGNA